VAILSLLGGSQGAESAVQEVEAQFGLTCLSILTLSEWISAVESGRESPGGGAVPSGSGALTGIGPSQIEALRAYRLRYRIVD
jgi:hypothetical protein